MSRRKLLSDDHVLDAALAVMFRDGGADFTLAQVALESGIATATLIQRFGDKRGLRARAIARGNQHFARALADAPRERSVEAVIDLFWGMTPGKSDEAALADQRLWLWRDLGDSDLNALARERLALVRQAVAERLPAMAVDPQTAARLVEAQWQGALAQWAVAREGRLADYVAESLGAWFALAAPVAPEP